MANEPERRVIRRASRSTFILIAVGIAMSGGGVYLAQQGQALAGWGLAAMFGVMTIVALVTVLPGSTQLELDRRGFFTTLLFQRGERIRWDEVQRFETVEVAGRRRAGYTLAPDAKAAAERPGAPEAHGGLDGVFMRDYGLGAEELADTMNAWRERWT